MEMKYSQRISELIETLDVLSVSGEADVYTTDEDVEGRFEQGFALGQVVKDGPIFFADDGDHLTFYFIGSELEIIKRLKDNCDEADPQRR